MAYSFRTINFEKVSTRKNRRRIRTIPTSRRIVICSQEVYLIFNFVAASRLGVVSGNRVIHTDLLPRITIRTHVKNADVQIVDGLHLLQAVITRPRRSKIRASSNSHTEQESFVTPPKPPRPPLPRPPRRLKKILTTRQGVDLSMNGIGVAVIAASAAHIIASERNYLISNDENRNMIVG
jgi:hypothetical protein